MKPISLPPDDPNAPQVADLAQRLSDTIGTTHSDVVFPALAAVFVATLARLPDASPDQALRAFETNVRGLISINRPRE